MLSKIFHISNSIKYLRYGYSFISEYHYQKCFKQQINKYDRSVQDIIKLMSMTDNMDSIRLMIQSYLSIPVAKIKSPKGLLGLLVAFNVTNDIRFKRYAGLTVEHITRSPKIEQFICNENQLRAILGQFSSKILNTHEKIKQNSLKYKASELILLNKDSITINLVCQIISFILSYDRSNVAHHSRFASIANIINQIIFINIRKYIENKNNMNKKNEIQQNYFINKISFFLKYFPPNCQDTNLLYIYFNKVVLQNNKILNMKFIYNIHKRFPSTYKTINGQYYKQLILQKIIKRQQIIKDQSQDWNIGLLCYSILLFQFYKVMDNIQFRYQNQFNYLIKQDLVLPSLHPYFWKKYQQFPHILNQTHITRTIVKDHYNDKYISTPEVQSNTIKPPKSSQNEIKVRMQYALQQLGLKSIKQVQVSGRYVDFLLDDNIIVECDGDHHFNLNIMQYDEDTHFRNLHLLLAGYKMIIINIFEYNQNRSTKKLADLLSKKLDLLNRKQAIIII